MIFMFINVYDGNRFALGGSPFTIHILIGEKSKVGSVYNFSTPPNSTGGHRQKASRALSKGQVHITNALLHDVGDDTKELKSLDPAEVTEYLKEKLRWKVTLVGLRITICVVRWLID
jgi:tyrosinase